MIMAFLCSSIAISEVNAESATNVEAELEEPFLWDLLFSNTKSNVPMLATPVEAAVSHYTAFPKTDISANKEKYTTGDRILIKNHVWLEGDYPPMTLDYYVAFFDISNPQDVYFFDGIDWGMNVKYQILRMPVGFDREDTILDIRLSGVEQIRGKYTFASGLAEPGTDTFYCISTVSIEIY